VTPLPLTHRVGPSDKQPMRPGTWLARAAKHIECMRK
jgi:hypothetical protein